MADAAGQDREALRAEFKRLVKQEGLTPDQAMARIRPKGAPRLEVVRADTSAPAPAPGPSGAESFGRGVVQGATMMFDDEGQGVARAAGMMPEVGLAAATNPAAWGAIARRVLNEGGAKVLAEGRAGRDAAQAKNEAAQQADPMLYGAGMLTGGVATAPVLPASALSTLKGVAVTGAGYGAAAGLGGSKADLTKGEIGKAVADAVVGAGAGVVGGLAGKALGSAFSAAGGKLKELGQARLFKAAVGQNKRAFTQISGKGLFQKSSEYLDQLGIGLGDSTESIGAKLVKRSDTIDDSIGNMVKALDEAAPGGVSPQTVAQRIETEVAAPLKKLAANQDDYAQVAKAVDEIRKLGDKVSFADAAAQRRAFQQRVNYDRQQGRDASAEATKRIAQIWNDVIDEAAEPSLKKMGEAGNAYRELRHESALAQELLGHVKGRIAGNQANRVISPSDYGAGGIAGIMTGNPLVGLAAAAANHVSRVYGNSAAGRAAINVGRLAAASPRALRVFAPAAAARAAAGNKTRLAYAADAGPAGDKERRAEFTRLVREEGLTMKQAMERVRQMRAVPEEPARSATPVPDAGERMTEPAPRPGRRT